MPVRLLREGILSSERIAMLDWAEEVFYRRLMSVVDDFGRYFAKSNLLRAACYPQQIDKVSDAEIERWVVGVERAGLVRVYKDADGKIFIELLNFHQQVRAKKSKFPNPPPLDGAVTGAETVLFRPVASEPEIKTEGGLIANANNCLADASNCLADAKQTLALVSRCSQMIATAHLDGDEDDKELSELDKSNSSSTLQLTKPRAKRIANCPQQAIVDLYHEVLPELPGVRVMDGKRSRAMVDLWRFVLTSRKSDGERRAESAEDALAWIRDYFGRVRDNDFLMGKTPRDAAHANWRPDLEYLCTSRGLKQVIEKTVSLND